MYISYTVETVVFLRTRDLPGRGGFRNRQVVFPPLALQQSINFILDLHTIFVICLENLKNRNYEIRLIIYRFKNDRGMCVQESTSCLTYLLAW